MKILRKNILVYLLGIFLLPACDSGSEDKEKPFYENLEESEKGADTSAAPKENTQITFEETEFDFGTINQGEIVNHIFKFKNTGNAPLLISDARASCGCTVPSYPKEPIAPGQGGEIKVQYNSTGKSNKDTKTVTVTANTEPAANVLKISAFVKTNTTSPIKEEK